jgi:hypothetical protein
MDSWEPSRDTLDQIGQAWSRIDHGEDAPPEVAVDFARQHIGRLYYAWVEEIVEDAVDIHVQSWPQIDDHGRMIFDDEPAAISVGDMTAGQLFGTRPSIGQVYAISVEALEWLADGAPDTGDATPTGFAVPISEDARDAAKAAFYAAVAPPDDETGPGDDGSGGDADAGGGIGDTPSPRPGPPPTLRDPAIGEPPSPSPDAITYRVAFDVVVDPSAPGELALRVVDETGRWMPLDPHARAVVVCVVDRRPNADVGVDVVAADPQWCPNNPTPWFKRETLRW